MECNYYRYVTKTLNLGTSKVIFMNDSEKSTTVHVVLFLGINAYQNKLFYFVVLFKTGSVSPCNFFSNLIPIFHLKDIMIL